MRSLSGEDTKVARGAPVNKLVRFQHLRQTHGGVLVLTASQVECKHAGRRKFALKSQFSKN